MPCPCRYGLSGCDIGWLYDLYAFERQPQTFPDVVPRTRVPGKTPAIILGLELKGWYALAKEGEPSFRYKVTPAVCGPADLIVIVPWTLSAVISGSPIVHEPYIAHAAFAAEYRNWFFRIFTEGYDFQDIEEKIGAIEVGDQAPGDPRGALERIAAVLIELARRISRPG